MWSNLVVLIALIITFMVTGLPNGALADVTKSDIVRLEQYFINLDNMKARFSQTDTSGETIRGTFYLDRPGKLRFDYDDPIKDYIVADGRFLYFWDSELQQQTNAPIGDTPAVFLLHDEGLISDYFEIMDVIPRDDQLIYKLKFNDESYLTHLYLYFNKSPFSLQKWQTIDGENRMIEISLDKILLDFNPDSELFYFRNSNSETWGLN